MKRTTITFHILLPVILIFNSCAENKSNSPPDAELYKGIEFNMPVIAEPVIPDYSVKITDFGAVADGMTLNTKAFAEAIERVSEKGGGKVIIPRGLWLTSTRPLNSTTNFLVLTIIAVGSI